MDHNATRTATVIGKTGEKILNNLDLSLYGWLQPYINRLYTGKYGSFFSVTFLGIPVANLIIALLVFFFFLMLRRFFASIVSRCLLGLARRTRSPVDDIIVRELSRPLQFLFVIIGLHLFFRLIFHESGWIRQLLEALLIFDLYWMLYAVTPGIKELLDGYSARSGHLSYELSRFLIRILRLLIVAAGIISILYTFGINVTAFVASLGLVGMAFALAAKDTAANLFGSIALLLDESIKIGEWIRVNGEEGVVEDIGMRTTKIRTFEQSFVVVPNSIVANTNIENFSRRGIRRIKMLVGLTYDTGAEQIRRITAQIRSFLADHEGIARDQTLIVRFERFEESSLGILIYAFANTSDWERYLQIREEINLQIMKIVERNGSAFAFPSRSIYLEKIPERGGEDREIKLV